MDKDFIKLDPMNFEEEFQNYYFGDAEMCIKKLNIIVDQDNDEETVNYASRIKKKAEMMIKFMKS